MSATTTDAVAVPAEPGPPELSAWREKALAVLRKARRAGPATTAEDVDGLLSSPTYDDFAIAPLHLGGPTAVRASGRRGPWDVRSFHPAAEPDVAAAIAEDAAGGATSSWVELPDPEVLPVVLEAASSAGTALIIDAGDHAGEAARVLFRWSERRAGAPPPRGNLGADPLGRSAGDGRPAEFGPAVELARRCAAGYPDLRAITVDATPYHHAGASDALELACALATGVAYLRALTGGGLDIDAALGQLEFRYAVGVDQWLSLAKLRAARLLWARVAHASGAGRPVHQRQHAVTSGVMMTARAPWTNIVRTTVAAFAAVVGGADAVTVAPFDSCRGGSGPEARRLARNTHGVLLAEAHAARVADPAAGSWYAERLTRDLAVAAWSRFQEIERYGGMAAAQSGGLIGEHLDRAWARRADDVRRLRRPIVGITEFVPADDPPPAREPVAGRRGGHLPRRRDAAEFERLRARAEAGSRPPVPVILLDSAQGPPRAALAERVLHAAGIATRRRPADDPPPDPEAGAVVVLCGPDDPGAGAADLVRRLRRDGVRQVWAVGTPAGSPVADHWLTPGGDAVRDLDTILDQLGAAR